MFIVCHYKLIEELIMLTYVYNCVTQPLKHLCSTCEQTAGYRNMT